MSAVYIVEEIRSDLDISSSKQFGRLIPVFTSQARRSSIFKPNSFGAEFVQRLEHIGFEPTKDFILMAGSTVAITFAVAAAVHSFGEITVLAFDRVKAAYRPLVVDSSNFRLLNNPPETTHAPPCDTAAATT